ncbi:efflux RND transporter permease subunit [Parahaliea mediterranea]|uniref:Efflux RND transporter permease subunit n=1 Tax=Parahaliea mediterranea TaxID=651086 RepID=A0A939DIN9_9GAMM|nr:efflux RND transporter permease subunit [Parahaliea mediterranea]MBN7798835.1 efflux RND transporter permease subunit [Parahaliea mediterranea]
MGDPRPPPHLLDRLVLLTLGGGLPRLLFIVGLLAGALALYLTPREEEPQIVVPMIDVLVEAPGLNAAQVERQVSMPLEKLLVQIPGVEHVYATSQPGRAAVTLAFHVGEDREESLLNSYNKLYSNQDRIPAVVSRWMLRPVEVDDIPILVLALWSEAPERYSDFDLRRMAEELTTALQALPHTGEVRVTGGRPRTIRVLLDPESLAARHTTAGDIARALQLSNTLQRAGSWTIDNESVLLESGDALRHPEALESLVVNVVDGSPVYLREVANIVDGPAEVDAYTWLEFSPTHPAAPNTSGAFPMVAISVAKQRGSNAVAVARQVHEALARLRSELLPPEVRVEVLRDYGATANDKVNNLASSLAFAIVTVVVFIGVFLGWRAALVVGMAVPVCYGITLALDFAFGYTINRVTLFALILSLGLLVDDPITGVDNISRTLATGAVERGRGIVQAMAEIRVPLLMSTLTIVVAFLPLAFITGMMGPYMAPMAFNVPVAVIASTAVAFLITPWLANRLLPSPSDKAPPPGEGGASLYARLMAPLLASRGRARWLVVCVIGLFALAACLPVLRLVPLKLLPFDNRNEVQVLIDMPESASLEHTAAIGRRVAAAVKRLPEVQAVAAFVGTPSPVDFNGMVRRYYQRTGPAMADLRLTLVDKDGRVHQSHAVVLRLRQLLAPLARDGVSLKVVEVPPGPPVMSTLVAEIHADTLTPYARQRQAATVLMERLRREPHVVEVDSTVQAPQRRWRFVTDKTKAALSGVATEDINTTLATANAGAVAGHLQDDSEVRPLPLELRLAPQQRGSRHDFERLQVRGREGIARASTRQGLEAAPRPLVALGELGRFEQGLAEQALHRKDLQPVVYVTAELSGRTPAEVIADVAADFESDGTPGRDWRDRSYLAPGGGDAWSLPQGTRVRWTGEGEWRITVDVFRDMGLAFAFALVAIFAILRVQTASTALSLIIMSAIPLTVIGIMPGFWLLNLAGEREVAGAPDPVLFTATAMIGMIALAGIVVRNSLILVEFVTQARAEGSSVRDALLRAGSVRMRPVLLTAGTTLLGNLVIILDPVFSGLALAIMFGILASTLFTLVLVPVVYMLVFSGRPGATAAEATNHG